MSGLEALGGALLRASAEGAAAVAVVWLVCRLAPGMPAAARCLLWWAACLKFVVALPGWGVVTVPLLPAEWEVEGAPAVERLDERGPEALADTGGGSRPVAETTGCTAATPDGCLPMIQAGLATGASGEAGRGADAETAPSPAVDGRGAGAAGPGAAGEGPGALVTLADEAPSAVSPAVPPPLRLARRAAAALAAALPWLAALWLAGVAFAAAGLGRDLRRLRRALAVARPVGEPRLAATLAALCRRMRLAPPALLASPRVSSPLVAGLRRPRIVLPAAGLAESSPAEAEMALCHELAHLRRRDLWLGLVPAAARTIFFFHPLAVLAAREHALAREAACDAEVLRVLGSAPRDYGRLLLRWGLAPRETGLAAAAAAPSRHHLKRRLLMLDLHDRSPRRRALAWAAPAALALLALLPLRLTAPDGEAALLDPAAAYPAPPPAPAAPAAPQAAPATPAPAPAPAVAAVPGVAPVAATPAVAPFPALQAPAPSTPAVAPVPAAPAVPGTAAVPAPAPFAPLPSAAAPSAAATAPAPPPPPPALSAAPAVAGTRLAAAAPPAAWASTAAPGRAPQGGSTAGSSSTTSSSSYSYSTSDDHAWMLLEGHARTTFSGGDGDLEAAARARRGDEPLLYVRQGGQAWVIRDPALLAEAKRALQPVTDLGRQQGELGGRQGALGGDQGELGRRQGALGAEQGRLAGEQGRLAGELGRRIAERSRLYAERSRAAEAERAPLAARIGELDREIAELQARIQALGDEQRELGERQRALGDEQQELGERQRELGEQQRRLGERQREASAVANAAIDEILARARESGRAEPVR